MAPSIRQLQDRIGAGIMLILSLCSVLILALMAWGLIAKSAPILSVQPLGKLLFSSTWNPLRGEFGFLPFLAGTLWVVGMATLIAVPISILTAIFLSEYAGRGIKKIVYPLLDLLAGIPSVVYGVWGMLAIVPLIKNHAATLGRNFSAGYCVLTAGIVLAVMIFPVIINICVEVLGLVPCELREASLALGATKWQTIKRVVLRKALPGILAANALGMSRAFGETMAVLMVAGNVVRSPRSILDPAYPLPALIANNYGEMMSIPLYDSALFFAALLLFAVVLGFSLFSRLVLSQIGQRIRAI